MFSSLYNINSTLVQSIQPTSVQAPFYLTKSASVLPFISDKYLSLAAPVTAYWSLSLIFLLIDNLHLPYFEKRRIHESPEVLSRNKATVWEVVKAIFWQHFIQTALGILALEDEEAMLKREVFVDHLAKMAALSPKVAQLVFLLCGKRSGEDLLKSHGEAIVRWTYWWGIPMAQMFFACFVMDTWEYFMHRLFHVVPYLYRNFHSVHHRLYVPYAFGALYNHPLEGFIFDSVGAVVSQTAAGLSMRQTILFFTISSIKTVDDHCGYRLWWDPCQFLFNNNVDYHDIHHQTFGIKMNFAQPFFTNWDRLLGTQMTREEVNARARRPIKVQKVE